MSILISHESPLCLLEESKKYNDYQYLLPYFYRRYPEYKKFMDGYQGLLIADNGLFEGETYTIQEQVQLIKETKCHVYIVQDSWNDSTTTLKDAKYWMGLKNSGVLEPKLNLMVVLQGKSFSEIELLYRHCTDLGYRHFAFNHASVAYQNEVGSVEDPILKSKIGRIKLIKKLWDEGVIKEQHWIHLLGATDVTEFHYYNQALPGVVNSVDTSSPIIKGIEDGLYNEDNMKTKSINKMEKYFEKDLDLKTLDCIFDNIKTFRKIINKQI